MDEHAFPPTGFLWLSSAVRYSTFLNSERSVYIEKLSENPALRDIPKSQLQNPEFLIRLTLDASVVLEKDHIDKDSWGLLELQTREFIHKIHHKRLSELKRLEVF